jgi:hypothetical protein
MECTRWCHNGSNVQGYSAPKTQSPTARPLTPLPIAVTSPQISEHGTNGAFVFITCLPRTVSTSGNATPQESTYKAKRSSQPRVPEGMYM